MSQPSSNDKSPKRRRSRRKPAAPAIKKSAKPATPPAPPAGAAAILGLDNTDGHKRITTGEQFAIVGGSAETHDRMTETVVKTFEELRQRGKHLAQVEHAELAEIIHKSTPR